MNYIKFTKRIKKNFVEFFIKINIYFAYFKMKFLNEIQYKIAALAGIATQFAWGGMYIMLYTTFLANGSSSDYTIQQMSTFLWLQQALLMLFNSWTVDKEIFEECESGQISMELIRPINLYSIWHARTFGKKVAATFLRMFPIIIICSLPFLGEYKLTPPVNIGAFIVFVITLMLSALILMSFIMLMYIVVMRNVSSKGVHLIFRIIIDFFSGATIPIAFMPDILVNILKYTPFYYMQNVPFNIYIGYISSPEEIAKIILIQIIWLIVLTTVGKKIMNNQLKKVVVQGG